MRGMGTVDFLVYTLKFVQFARLPSIFRAPTFFVSPVRPVFLFTHPMHKYLVSEVL